MKFKNLPYFLIEMKNENKNYVSMWAFLFSKKITNFQAFHWGISSSIRPLISEEYLPLEYTYIL